MARITDIVKTYRFINDPNAPPWSVRFVGALAALGIVLAAGGAFLMLRGADDAPAAIGPSSSAATDGAEKGEASLARIDLAPGAGEAAMAGAVAQWRAEHPDAVVESAAPIRSDGRLVAVEIRYR
ncbi:MAG TPA: hypothetical protein VHH36_04985 [Candidatus Thermoplasmatota archaeon]|nr:hypothetical protein [Candidatus Thermoplasmatota archaeon]